MKKTSRGRVAKAEASPSWIMWLVVLVLIIVGGVYYFRGGVVGSQAGTDRGVVYVSRDPGNPLSGLTIGGTSKQIDSRWKLAYASDDQDPKKQVSLVGITFTTSNATKVASTAYLRDISSAADYLPIVAQSPVTGDRVQFALKQPIPIKNNKYLRLEVMFDLNRIDGTTVTNDTPYLTKIALPQDVKLLMSTSSAVVVKLDQSNPVTNYLFKTKPVIAFAKDTPAGALVSGPNTMIAKVKVTADAAGDVSFTKASKNYLTFKVNSRVNDNQQTTAGWKVVDLTGGGVVLALGKQELESGADIVCDFSVADFWVGAGSTKVLAIYADTSDYEDTGDALQVWLKGANDQLGWSIEGLLGNYRHGDILFRGGLYGGMLVKK